MLARAITTLELSISLFELRMCVGELFLRSLEALLEGVGCTFKGLTFRLTSLQCKAVGFHAHREALSLVVDVLFSFFNRRAVPTCREELEETVLNLLFQLWDFEVLCSTGLISHLLLHGSGGGGGGGVGVGLKRLYD